MKDATPIGRVTSMRVDECWTGGTWLWVHAQIDPPEWLRTGCGVSISRSALHTRDMGTWGLVRGALLNEVSILSPGVEPQFPRARVVWIGEPESSAVGLSSDRPVVDEVIHHGRGERIVRVTGEVLGAR
jgi:hypothetical protein